MPRDRIEPGSPQLRKGDSSPSQFFFAKGGRMIVVCTLYPDAGTAWNLQVKSPIDDSSENEVWVDTGITVDSVGYENREGVLFSPFLKYRFSGGTIGTEIWVTPAYSGMGAV